MAKVMLNGKEFCRAVNVPTLAKEYGATVSDILGVIDSNGALQPSTKEFILDLTGVEEIPANVLQDSMKRKGNLIGLLTPDLKIIRSSGMNAFAPQSNIREFVCPKLVLIENSGCYYVMQTNYSLTTVSMPNLIEVGNSGLSTAFSNCLALTTVILSSLTTLGTNALSNAFGSTPIKTMSFPALYSVQANSFGSSSSSYCFNKCNNLIEIHFRADAQATIEAMTGYADKWGATNATIYFDL